jgi:hypothetical protein
LKQRQPIEGVQIVALGFHVDYWDHQGWKDRFSSPQFTERQKSYAARFHDDVYTPQMVVDGVGLIRDSRTLPPVLTKAAGEHKPLEISLDKDGDNLEVRIRGSAHNAEAYVALVEDDLETSVAGGENQGHQLHHAAVVRDWRPLGRVTKRDWAATTRWKLSPDAKTNKIQIVAFAQDPATGKILGLASIPFESATASFARPK